ncbi:MAG: hypothetical protein AAGE84_27860 [Cyanobacteria bacterium P01_G01_bin.39]
MYFKPKTFIIALLSLTSYCNTVYADSIESLNKTTLISSENCVDNSGDIRSEREDITIGREFFTSLINFRFNNFETENPISITCSLNNFSNPETFKLLFGIQDYTIQGKHEVIVNVYLDGKKAASNAMISGVGKTLLFDINNIENIGIEAICTYIETARCPDLHIVEASVTSNP